MGPFFRSIHDLRHHNLLIWSRHHHLHNSLLNVTLKSLKKMKFFSTHRPMGGWLFFCLLLTFCGTSLVAQTTFCPDYPRAFDESYICLVIDGDKTKLELDQRAMVHNPVRFVFPNFAFSPNPDALYNNKLTRQKQIHLHKMRTPPPVPKILLLSTQIPRFSGVLCLI